MEEGGELKRVKKNSIVTFVSQSSRSVQFNESEESTRALVFFLFSPENHVLCVSEYMTEMMFTCMTNLSTWGYSLDLTNQV